VESGDTNFSSCSIGRRLEKQPEALLLFKLHQTVGAMFQAWFVVLVEEQGGHQSFLGAAALLSYKLQPDFSLTLA